MSTDSSRTYHSSTRGHIPASGKTKQLMHNLRVVTHAAMRSARHGACIDWNDISERRADIVEYIGKLEAALAVHQAEQQRRERAQAFSPRGYQKTAVDFINRYSSGTMFLGFDEASKIDATAFAKLNWRETEKRVVSWWSYEQQKRPDWHSAAARKQATRMAKGLALQ